MGGGIESDDFTIAVEYVRGLIECDDTIGIWVLGTQVGRLDRIRWH
jgi:hypothetical protein